MMARSHRFVAIAIAASAVGLVGCSERLAAPIRQDATTGSPRANFSTALLNDGYVRTPFGLYHQSCVHELPNGAHAHKDGSVTLADGSKIQLPTCTYPHYWTNHNPLSSASSPTINGWVEDYVTTYTSNPYGLPDPGLAGLSAIYADVIVPPAPVGTYYNLGSSGMTYFTFTAFEPSDGSEIVQPVLQYGWSQAGGGQNWAMATWDCGRPTGCLHSVLKTAYPGDSIHTWVYGQPTSWNALDFNVFMQDMTTGQQVINIYEPYKTMTNGFGNVVEAYSLYACNNYPYPSVTWKNITVYADTGLTKITPSWSYEPRGTSQSPQCTYGGQNGSTFLTLLHY